MTDQQLTVTLRAFTERGKFRPFVIEFLNGKQLEINHPEGVAPLGNIWVFLAPD